MAIVDIDQIRTSHSLGARGLRRVAPHIMAMQAPKLYEATLGHPEEAFRRTMLDIDDMPCGRCSPDLDTCPRGHYRTFRTGHGQCETQACEKTCTCPPQPNSSWSISTQANGAPCLRWPASWLHPSPA